MSTDTHIDEKSVPAGEKPSAVEGIKARSRHLRGPLEDELGNDDVKFSEEAVQLLKFHGSYQQYDRTTATERKKAGLEKEYSLMTRVRIPGGRLTAEQYLLLDTLADRFANGTLRLTTRQGIQFHGVLKGDLQPFIHEINAALMTTFGACGDVVRNIMAAPSPRVTPVMMRLQKDAEMLSRELLPRTAAYHEIWVDDTKVAGGDEDDPLYGELYLPRKFKIGLATVDDNSLDVLSNDLAFVAITEGEQLIGYNVAVGGGMGMTHNKPETYPRVASFMAFVPAADLLAMSKAVITVQRDYGNRSNRRRARLKYLIDDRGLDWFRGQVATVFGAPLAPPRPLPPFGMEDHLGWQAQGDGRFALGIPVMAGRIADRPGQPLKSVLREIVEEFRPGLLITPNQDFVLTGLAAGDQAPLEARLAKAGVDLGKAGTRMRRWAMACPALPTCGLALSDAERVLAGLVSRFEEILRRHGLEDEEISLRMTGCPNGCARPYTGTIGIVGRTPGHYAIFVGGDFENTRLSQMLVERVNFDDVPSVLAALIADFAANRQETEKFGAYCARLGLDDLRALVVPVLERAAK